MLLAATHAAVAREAPVFEQRFNGPSDVELVNGAALGGPGSGVSGQPDDLAYQAPVASAEDVQQPAGIVPMGAIPDALEEVTVTVWYRLDARPTDATTLLNVGGVYLLWQGADQGAWNMRLQIDLANHLRAWFNPNKPASILPWNAEAEWIFYALTWKQSSGEVVVYQGTAQEPAAEQRRWATSEATLPLNNALYQGAPGILGNSLDTRTKRPGQRAFAGRLDNVRIFARALAADEIDKLRTADAVNAVP